MAERQGAAVDVDHVVDAEDARGVDRNPREGFIDLHEIQVLGAPSSLLEGEFPGVPGNGQQVRRLLGDLGVGDNGPEGFETPPLCEASLASTRAPAPSVTPGAFPAVTVPPSSIGGSLASFSRVVS